MIFSVTMLGENLNLTKFFLSDLVKNLVTQKSISAAIIDQRVLFLDLKNNGDLLETVFQDENIQRVLVFTRRNTA